MSMDISQVLKENVLNFNSHLILVVMADAANGPPKIPLFL
jgi:hypothetical protein